MQFENLMAHYRRPEVKEAILSHAELKENWRIGCAGHKGWYKYFNDQSPRPARLKEDYDMLINRLEKSGDRSLYWSLNFNSPESKEKHCYYAGDKWHMPLDYDDIRAYSFGVDIDLKGEKLVTQSDARKALEKAAQFLINQFQEKMGGLVNCYFSGNGVYVLLGPEIIGELITKEKIKNLQVFLKKAKKWIKQVEHELFTSYKDLKEYIKYDAILNKNRVFKTILSIHKDLNFACIPLDTFSVQIDLDRTTIPISESIIKRVQEMEVI